MTHQRAADSGPPAIVSLDAQSGRPLTQRQPGETRNYHEVEYCHHRRKHDCSSLGGIAGCARAAAEQTCDQGAGDNYRNECDVVDQQSAATERKGGSESLSAMSGGAASCLRTRQTLSNSHAKKN